MVTAKIAASTSNLGPGFDSLGCALSLFNTYTFALSDRLEITGCPEAYCNENNLTVVAFRKVCDRIGKPFTGLRMTVQSEIPVSRGLGSSAAMLVAGALGANALYGNPLTTQDLFAICTEIEGHPDNIAPMLFGGLTVAVMDGDRPRAVNCAIHPDLRFLALIPDFPLSTKKARALLPDRVPRKDAIFNLSRAAMLPQALASGDEALIRAAMQDRLHEPYRRSLIPGIDQLEQQALAEGALGFCISGAGPACLCVTKDPTLADRLTLPEGWRVHILSPVNHGPQIKTEKPL